MRAPYPRASFTELRLLGAIGGALLIVLGNPVRSQAQLAYEPFNYTVGSGFSSNSDVATNATGFSGNYRFSIPAEPNSTVIGSGSLAYTDGSSVALPTTGNQYQTSHGAMFVDFDTGGGGAFASYLDGASNIGANGTTLYVGVAIQTTNSGIFSGFSFSRDSDADSARVVSIDSATSNHSGSHNYFLTTWQPTNSPVQQADLGFINNNVNFFVLRFDFGTGGTDTATIYANPSLASEPGSASGTVTGSDLSFDRMDVRNFGATLISVDELRVGTTYAAVTAIPEPSMTAAIAGLLALAALVKRRHGRGAA